MKTIEDIAEEVGLDTSQLRMWAASFVTSHGRPFVDRADLVDFAAAVRREALEAEPSEAMEIAGMRALRNTYRTVTGAYSREQARACYDAMRAEALTSLQSPSP